MTTTTTHRRRPTSAAPRTGRLALLDAIVADVETGLTLVDLGVDDPGDTEPCRAALKARLRRLHDAAWTLRRALLATAV